MSTSGWDVARRAGVSQSTVSRVFRGETGVRDVTRERVLAVARELGYLPHDAARSLITRRTGNVGVVLPSLRNPLYPELVGHVQELLVEHGYRMLLVPDDRDAEGGPGLDPFRTRAVDGILLASATSASPVVAELVAAGVPVVLINRDVEGVRLDRVLPDERAVAALVVDHITSLGHTRAALLHGPPDTVGGRLRAQAFRNEAARAGLTLPDIWVHPCPYDHDAGMAAALPLLDRSRDRRPTAILCADDAIALGALDAALALGLRVPTDVSVVGVDGVAMSGWPTIELTTVRLPLPAMAAVAVEWLLDRVAGGTGRARRRLFKGELVVRGSTGAPLAKSDAAS